MTTNNRERSISVSCENISCEDPELAEFTPTEFVSFVQNSEFECRSCNKEMSAEGYRIECFICDMEFEGYSISEIALLLDERCGSCAGSEQWDVDFYSIRIVGSWSAEFDVYDWGATRKNADDLARAGRTDYWEGLVHFCSAEEFVSIYRDRCIRASSTGLYNKLYPAKTKAVCLTETTIPNWQEIKDKHGQYGFVFRKSEIIRLGGAPVISLLQSVIDKMKHNSEAIPETLWPYLTKLALPTPTSRRKFDFLHEREWRVPRDIRFDLIVPLAVTFAKERPGIDDEELILHAAREFQELSESPSE